MNTLKSSQVNMWFFTLSTSEVRSDFKEESGWAVRYFFRRIEYLMMFSKDWLLISN